MAKKTEWHPLKLDELPNCRLIGCDPSLAALGIVLIEVHDGQVYVNEAEKLSTAQTEDGGWESNFDRSELLYDLLTALLDGWNEEWDLSSYVKAVHESRPSGGGSIMRPESSILGGREFRRAALDIGFTLDKLVTPQAHKKLISGNHIATKTQYANAIKDLLPKIHESRLITNEAIRDALGIALYAAHRKGEAG